MSPLQAWLAFVALCAFGLLLPFLPALRTLRRPEARNPAPEAEKDAPARIEAFRGMVTQQFAQLLQVVRESEPIQGANESGRPFIVLGFNKHLAECIPPATRRLRSLVLSAGHLDIPGELVCDREIFAEGRINVAHNAVVKSVLSHRDIAIGIRARVTRWVRSDRRLDVAEGGSVKGFASAGIEIALARRTRFEQLEAPRISFGRQPDSPARPALEDPVARFDPPSRRGEQLGNGRNLVIPPGHTVRGDLIVAGLLEIGDGCRIFGQLRADKGIVLGQDVQIEGAVYADGPISTGANCLVSGPLISASSLRLGPCSRVGKPDEPSTLAADELLVSEGCVAYGTVRAGRRGEVIDARIST
ncbi:hypothetical protein [Uliginosibacterium sp. TH139]|uniref:hypothetical protein n=1 Tax=Uliginosibacterium sp. TH139 TaxID=2067453 RepID=UPI000C7B08C1|nr:hypothetical protein [Uliginosibacterium sp. TH139]PLK48539.1 hypothetical protein C0V76_10745 [Uliginosibacterium sp. TH139]